MSDTLLSRIGAPIGHILHIGAGVGTEIPGYLAADPKAVILVEPDPASVALLQVAAQAHQALRVIEAAVSADPQAGPLHRFTFGGLNSLRAPTGLHDLFPGLEELDSEPVALRDPVALVGGLDLDADHAHVLVIEAPGEALAILQALDKAGLLVRFAAVRVQEDREPLYEGAGTAAQAQALLGAAGFVLDVQMDEDDPDRPVLSALLAPAFLRSLALEEELKQVRSDRDALKVVASDLKEAQAARIGELKASADKLRQARQAGLEQLEQVKRQLGKVTDARDAASGRADSAGAARKAAEARVTALEGEREAQAAEREAQAARIGELKASADKLRQARQAGLEQLDEQVKRQLGKVTDARDAASGRADSASAACKAAEARVAALEGELEAQAAEREAQAAQIGELTAVADTLHQARQAAEDELKTAEALARRESGHVKGRLTRRENMFSEQAQKLSTAEARVTELEGEQEAQAAEREAHAAQIGELTAVADTLHQARQAAEDELKTVKTLARRESGHVKGRLTRRENMFSEQAQKLSTAEARVTELEAELKAQVARVGELKASADKLRQAGLEQLEQAKRQLGKVTDARDAASGQADSARAARKAAEARVVELEQELKAQAARVGELKASADKLRQAGLEQLEQAKRQLGKVTDARDAASGQGDSARAARKAAEARVVKLEQELKAQAARVGELKASADKLRQAGLEQLEQLEQAKRQLGKVTDARDAASAQGDSAGAARKAAEAQVTQLEGELKAQAGELEDLRTMDRRLVLSQEDMLRAEGQIEIIKDLLLRGPGL